MNERENTATSRPVKQPVSVELRQRILELRRACSLQQVAEQTGIRACQIFCVNGVMK